jgi:sulfur carrier protein ThiS
VSGNTGWLTLHEVLEETGLPYRDLLVLVDQSLVTTRASGGATLYDLDDVRRLVKARS